MAKVPIYEFLYPEEDKLNEAFRVLDEATKKLVKKRAKDASEEIHYLTDNNERFRQIYYFIYLYLIFYEYTNYTPSVPNTSLLLLQNKNDEMERNFKILSQKYNKLLNQTSNMFAGEDVKMLQQELEQVKGNLIHEQNQRANAEEKLEKITTQRDKLVQTVEANRNVLENYSKLQDTLEKVTSGRDSLAKYANTLQEEKEKLEEQLQEFQNSRQGKKFLKTNEPKKENKELKAEIEALKTKNAELQKQNEKFQRAEFDSSGSLEAKENRINQLKQELNAEKAETKRLQDELFQKEEEIRNKEIIISNMRSAKGDSMTKTLQEELNDKKREIRELRKQLELLQNPDQLQNLHKKLNPESEWPLETTSSAELESLRAEINQLNNQLSQKNAEIQQFQNREIPDNSAELDSLREQLQQEKDTALQNLRSQLEQEKNTALQNLRFDLEQQHQQDLQAKESELQTLRSDLDFEKLAKSQLEKTNQDLTAKQSEFTALQSEVQELRSKAQAAQEEAKKEEIKQQTVSELSLDMKIAVSDTELDNQPDAEFYNVREAMTGELTFQESDELRAPIVIIHGKAYPNAYYYRNLLTGQGMGGMETLKNIFDFENVGNTSVCILAEFIPAAVSEDGEIRLLKRGKLIMK